jgi:zinc/manganese transport system ATP-binding protein
MTMKRPAPLVFHDLTLGYARRPAVHHLDGAVSAGTLMAVVGPNGAGKSTLLKGIAGTLSPLAGRIERNGLDPREIAWLPQAAEVDRSFPINVYDLVAMGLWRKAGLFGGIGARARQAIETAIAAVGLTGFESRIIGSLSGGQMQRTLFARLLLQDARVILLDEPFTAIDTKTANDLLALVRRWHGEERTVIAVLHDLDVVKAHFPDCLVLAREAVAWGRTEEALTPETMLTARRLIEAWDLRAGACERAA